MAGLFDTITMPDLRPVAAEAGAAEGDPRLVYTWAGLSKAMMSLARSYLPSDGGAPRLVAAGRVEDEDTRRLASWACGTPAPAPSWGGCVAASLGAGAGVLSPTSGPRTAAPGSPRARMEAAFISGTAMTSNSSTPYGPAPASEVCFAWPCTRSPRAAAPPGSSQGES
jgi:hypothetical protein